MLKMTSTKNITDHNKGFTIIEILIVLAIAGLIILILFLTIPTLQRNFRNSSRRRDASLLYSAVSECFGVHGNFNSCNEVSELNIDLSTLSIYSNFHFGAACTNWYINGCAQYPPTLDEPNWLNHLNCIGGNSLGNTTESYKFVVGYFIETPGTPAYPPYVPAGVSGRCLPLSV